jgi:hypothetical protein
MKLLDQAIKPMKEHAMTIQKSIAALVALLLGAAIVWAMGEKAIGDSFAEMIRDPWGIVTLIDLYAGFIAFALVLAYFEKPWVAVLLFVLMCGLGNLISLGWLVIRGFSLFKSRLESA